MNIVSWNLIISAATQFSYIPGNGNGTSVRWEETTVFACLFKRNQFVTFHIPWNIHHRGALFFLKVNSFCKNFVLITFWSARQCILWLAEVSWGYAGGLEIFRYLEGLLILWKGFCWFFCFRNLCWKKIIALVIPEITLLCIQVAIGNSDQR